MIEDVRVLRTSFARPIAWTSSRAWATFDHAVTTPTRADLAHRLVGLREGHDPPLNQQEAAELIGLSVRQYGRLERGEADASLATIRKVAAAYGVRPHVLTGAEPSRLQATGQAPSLADFARLEAKVDLLLDHLGALSHSAVPDPLSQLLHEHREHARRRRTSPVGG